VLATVIVTRSRRSTQELELAALSDPLTELLNLRGFKAAIQQRWPDEFISHSAVLQLDMDYLKRLNDSLGHAVGDKAIVCVAEAIRKSARDGEGDIAARIGGDEFVVIVVSKVPLEAARRVARRVVEQLAGVTSIDDMPVSLRISFGISCAVEPTPIEEVLRAADNDMLTAKSTRAAVVPQDSALS
ncbi:MAG: diguanylate cyclase domain-containing protein, partial [Acidimicrobiales bacterium]